jgi:hypothetical protein
LSSPTRNTLFGYVLCLILAGFYACGARADNGDAVYTLYRNSVVGTGMRLHVATFEAPKQPTIVRTARLLLTFSKTNPT